MHLEIQNEMRLLKRENSRNYYEEKYSAIP